MEYTRPVRLSAIPVIPSISSPFVYGKIKPRKKTQSAGAKPLVSNVVLLIIHSPTYFHCRLFSKHNSGMNSNYHNSRGNRFYM